MLDIPIITPKAAGEASSHSVNPETPRTSVSASQSDACREASSHCLLNDDAYDELPSSPATSDLDSDLDARSFVMVARGSRRDFSQLSRMLKERIRVLKQLQEFYKLKATYEESFARNMNKLANARFGYTESGQLAVCLDTLLLETLIQAQNHGKMGRKIRYELLPEVGSMIQKLQTLLDEEIMPAEVDADSGDAWDSQDTDDDQWDELEREMTEMEYKRGDFLKDTIWQYANLLSVGCVSDDKSCERIRVALEQFEPTRETDLKPSEKEKVVDIKAPSPTIIDTSRPKPEQTSSNATSPTADGAEHPDGKRPLLCSCFLSRMPVPGDFTPTVVPLPRAVPIPPPSQMFYVKALYDYVATNDVELSFKAGDVISVTATTEDGWWAGEHLDKSKRVIGKFLFPCNFVYRIPGLTDAVLTSTNSLASTSSTIGAVSAGCMDGSTLAQWPLNPAPTAVQDSNGSKPSRLLPQERSRVKFFVKTDFPFLGIDPLDLSFDAGDIIAVTATPDDGWWHGEPVNESKRVAGKYVFPSNFVHRL
ncbi:hypothetical protein NLJ89_g9163 [Agrocybe chaxingu]|uniref:SH3 domain-containing protein n=1 Tax=Agrocybe chaxingu TaxID=84603 RepID=A0A9W8K0H6_9AGAR|nr:hypothetical protein NLJ89_g9163 [Agrocybe chaxingu]